MSKLREQLRQIAVHSLDYPGRENLRTRVTPPGAAVCVLFSGTDFESAKILLTERSQDVKTHRGQVAFPGGRYEDHDLGDASRAAIRECEEEVGIASSAIESIGTLPLFPTKSGDFEVIPVICMIERMAPLILQQEEVAKAEWVSVRELRASRVLEKVQLRELEVEAPVFTWGARKMWGLSAWIFDLILLRYDTISV